ncbi:hypothetical protein MTO96_049402 [Rhipicephalus appendiculatus]
MLSKAGRGPSIFSLVGDLFDLEGVLKRPWDSNSMSQILACSAVVKVVGDFEDMYIAHDAWFLYRGMLRVQKHCIFPWHRTAHQTGVGYHRDVHCEQQPSTVGNCIP